MKRYLRYYNITRLTTPTKNGVFFMILFVLLNIIIYNGFISLNDMYTVGLAMMFLWSLFAVIYYTHNIHLSSSHPIYQFPLDSRDRVFNSYISVIFIFFSIAVGMILFGITMVGLFTLFGDLQNESINDPFYLAGTIYSIGYTIIVFAAFMPTSFIANVKRRFIHGFVSIVTLVVFNYIINWIVTGKIISDTSIIINMENTSNGLLIAVVVLIISILLLLVSYSTSKKLST